MSENTTPSGYDSEAKETAPSALGTSEPSLDYRTTEHLNLRTTELPQTQFAAADDSNDTPVASHEAAKRPSPRVGTMVWGAVVIAVAALVVIARMTSIQLDPAMTAMWILLGAGLAMVAGGAAYVLRKR